MLRRLGLTVGSVALALLVAVPSAGAGECIEVGQFKHCLDP